MEPVYKPLVVMQGIEADAWMRRHGSFFQRILCRIHKLIPMRIYYEIPYGRASVEYQLQSRSAFPSVMWSEAYSHSAVVAVLKIVAKEMNLPNYFFAPNDPLMLVLTEDFDELASEGVRLGIRERLGVTITVEDLKNLCVSNATIEAFVHLVLSRYDTERPVQK